MQNNNSTASTASSLADPSALLTLETFRRVPLSVAASGPDAAAVLLSAPCRELLLLGAARGARTALWVCAAPDCSLAAAAVVLARKLEEIFAGDAALEGAPRVLVTDFSPALLEEAGYTVTIQQA